MKYLVIFLFSFLASLAVHSQDLAAGEKNLIEAFSKIKYWSSNRVFDDKINYYDSLETANQDFLKLFLRFVSKNKHSVSYGFKNLEDSGLWMATSQDGLFRIYTWDTRTGGSMHIFMNVFQFSNEKKTFAQASQNSQSEGADPGCLYNQVNDIVSKNKKYYVTQSRSVLSSGLFYYNIKIFSIDGIKLNSNAKLIKTKTGVKNQLGYEADLTAAANRDGDVPEFNIEYDTATKTISIPVIQENGKITTGKIKYQFKGTYFEKL